MKNFMNHDFNISNISLATYVCPKQSDKVHNNRPSHGLAFMLKDTETLYQFENELKLNVKANEIIYLPKHSNYTADINSAGTGCYAINYDLPEIFSCVPFVFKPKNKTSFRENFAKAHHLWKTKPHGYMMKVKAVLYDILFDMQNEYAIKYMDSKSLSMILPAVEYIHQNYTSELLNVTMLSNLCNISPEYFRKLFKQAYGTSPVKYINHLKITRAKELLSSEMCTIAQVAEMSGYSDTSHFSREFKKATGYSPSAATFFY